MNVTGSQFESKPDQVDIGNHLFTIKITEHRGCIFQNKNNYGINEILNNNYKFYTWNKETTNIHKQTKKREKDQQRKQNIE